jgi:hypothetical protein
MSVNTSDGKKWKASVRGFEFEPVNAVMEIRKRRFQSPQRALPTDKIWRGIVSKTWMDI